MEFLAQIKSVNRISTASNDTEFRLTLITDVNLKDLCDIQADEMVVVKIEKDES